VLPAAQLFAALKYQITDLSIMGGLIEYTQAAFFLIVIPFQLISCGPSEGIQPGVILNHELKGKQVFELVEPRIVKNCDIDLDDNINSTACKNVWSEEGIEWQWGTHTGFGGMVDLSPFGLGVNFQIGHELSKVYGGHKQGGSGTEYCLNLKALPGQIMVYTISWIITQETGIITVESKDKDKPVKIQYSWPSNVDGSIQSGIKYYCQDTIPPTPTTSIIALPPVQTHPVDLSSTSTTIPFSPPPPNTTQISPPPSTTSLTPLPPIGSSLPVFETVVPAGNLTNPQNIALDREKNIYINDLATGSIEIFHPDGQYKGSILFNDQVQDFAISQDQNLILVTASSLEIWNLSGTRIYSFPLPSTWSDLGCHHVAVSPQRKCLYH
jgi:hypothetical protein